MFPIGIGQEYTRGIGVVFGQRTQLWWDIAVIESFRLLKRIYDVSDRDFEEQLEIFQAVLNLKPLLHTPVRKLSLGERMRCDLAAAFLHSPRIVFLDEPTIGLDVVAKENIRQFLKRINAELKVTVILTTHDLSDIEELCRRVLIIDRGHLLFDGSLEALRGRFECKSQIVFELREAGEGRFRAVGVQLFGGVPATGRPSLPGRFRQEAGGLRRADQGHREHPGRSGRHPGRYHHRGNRA